MRQQLQMTVLPKAKRYHWVVYDLPATIGYLAEGVIHQPTLPDGGAQGKNDFGQLGFGGFCPLSHTHRYFFNFMRWTQ